MSHTFAGRIHLGDLYGVEYETREINGIEEECIVIPIQPNGMHKSKKFGVSIPIRVAEKKTRGHSFFYATRIRINVRFTGEMSADI